jgi:hypothetical protein
LTINGEEIKNIIPGEYAEIKKTWLANNTISLNLDMRGRLKMHGTDHKYAAIVRGPIVLARDTQLPNTNLGRVITPIKDANGYIQLTSPDVRKENTWMEYVASFLPESYTEEGPIPIPVSLCDYASAGNGEAPSSFQVWMPQLYDPREH